MFGLFKRKGPATGSAKPRPVQFTPGNYATANARLIKIQSEWLRIEWLWREEAKDSDNPARKLEAIELADTARKFHDGAVAFYTRWEIEP